MTYIVPVLPHPREEESVLDMAISQVHAADDDLLVVVNCTQDSDPQTIDHCLDNLSLYLDAADVSYRLLPVLPREDLIDRMSAEVKDPCKDVVVVQLPVQTHEGHYHLGGYIRRILAEVPAQIWVVRV